MADLKTPHEWMTATGIRLVEAGKWPAVMTRDDFITAAAAFGSERIRRWPKPLFDERDEPSMFFVEALKDAIKSEFGPEFGLGISGPEEMWTKMARGIAIKMGVGDGDESGGVYIVALDPGVEN